MQRGALLPGAEVEMGIDLEETHFPHQTHLVLQAFPSLLAGVSSFPEEEWHPSFFLEQSSHTRVEERGEALGHLSQPQHPGQSTM